jgi:hypothetical protein
VGNVKVADAFKAARLLTKLSIQQAVDEAKAARSDAGNSKIGLVSDCDLFWAWLLFATLPRVPGRRGGHGPAVTADIHRMLPNVYGQARNGRIEFVHRV